MDARVKLKQSHNALLSTDERNHTDQTSPEMKGFYTAGKIC